MTDTREDLLRVLLLSLDQLVDASDGLIRIDSTRPALDATAADAVVHHLAMSEEHSGRTFHFRPLAFLRG